MATTTFRGGLRYSVGPVVAVVCCLLAGHFLHASAVPKRVLVLNTFTQNVPTAAALEQRLRSEMGPSFAAGDEDNTECLVNFCGDRQYYIAASKFLRRRWCRRSPVIRHQPNPLAPASSQARTRSAGILRAWRDGEGIATELDWYMDWKINKNFTASLFAAIEMDGH